MRMSRRIALSRRIEAAERVVQGRVLERIFDLLGNEWDRGDWRTREAIETFMARIKAREIDMAHGDICRGLLAEIAIADAALAARIAAAVNVTLPEPPTIPQE
jgi:hypothetical protein